MKKAFLKQAGFYLLLGGFILNSCKKEEVVSGEKTNSESEIHYYLDDELVSRLGVDFEDDGVFVVEIRNKPAGENSRATVVHEKRVFTSEEKYVEYGEANGFKFKEQLEFEKMMQDIAGAAGLIEEYDRTGEIPEWYIEREKVVYDSLFFSFKGANAKISNSLVAVLYEDFYEPGSGGSRSITIAATYPVMPPSWNNVVSCVAFFGAAGGLHIYDRTFYRSRLITLFDWALIRINLPPGINDKMSSGIRFF